MYSFYGKFRRITDYYFLEANMKVRDLNDISLTLPIIVGGITGINISSGGGYTRNHRKTHSAILRSLFSEVDKSC